MYFHGVRDFDAMLNVSKALRTRLADAYTLARPEVVSEQVSTDGIAQMADPYAADR